MFRLKTKYRQQKPSRGYQWIDPITLWELNTASYANWLAQAAEHRVGNALPLVEPEEMEAQLCAGYDAGKRKDFCEEYDDGGVVKRLGVGSTLKSMLAGMGISACFGCMNLAGRMDSWGPDGCEEHMDEILEIMDENASKRNWYKFIPFKQTGSRALVMIAIMRVRNQDGLSTETT